MNIYFIYKYISIMKIPFIYSLSHYLLGFLSFRFKFLILIFIIYQLTQYVLNIRFFLLNKNCITNFKKCVKKGNNLVHTLRKFGEFLIGYLLSQIIFYK